MDMITVSNVSKAFGGAPVLVDVSASVERGQILVLLGPSGCGKTTLLRLIAGLDHPDTGSISVDGDVVVEGNGQRPKLVVPTEKREVGMVFQDWALFPHMTVAENIAFGLEAKGTKKGVAAERVDEMLAMVGLEGFGDRMPGTLSGGQQQRVAVARSLAPSPKVLLFDEPFSNLDAVLRAQLRSELRQLLATVGTTSIFVTHDREEALELGNQIAVMDNGRIAQTATPTGIYEHPVSPWVAGLVGDCNLINGTIHTSKQGRLVASTVLGDLVVDGDVPGGESVVLLLRPEQLRLHSQAVPNAHVIETRYRGNETLTTVRLIGADNELVVREYGRSPSQRGDAVTVAGTKASVHFWQQEHPGS